MNKRKVVVVGLGGMAGVGILADAAAAHTGHIGVSEDCNGWQVHVALDHNTTINRTVDVVTDIPGTQGISGGHYTTAAGEIWSASGNAGETGTVTLNISTNGHLEFTDTAKVVKVEGCVTTTTEAPTTTTLPKTETTVPLPSCQIPEGCEVTTTTVPATSTTLVMVGGSPPISCQEDMPCWDCHTMGNLICGTTTTSVPALPHTGAAETGISAGVGVVALAIGVLIWRKVGSKIASVRG